MIFQNQIGQRVHVDGIEISWGDAFAIAFKFYIALAVIAAVPAGIALLLIFYPYS